MTSERIAATAAALAFGLLAFSPPTYGQTRTVSTQAEDRAIRPFKAHIPHAAQDGGGPFNAFNINEVPVAVTVFPGEIYRAPRSWGEQAFKKLIYWNEVDKGGHFAANEQPQLFAKEMRAAFRSLRQQSTDER